jgi:hypothetical protein
MNLIPALGDLPAITCAAISSVFSSDTVPHSACKMIIEPMDKKTEATTSSDSPSDPDAPPAYGTVAIAGPSTSPAGGNDQRGLVVTPNPKVPPKPVVATDKIRIEQRSNDITGEYAA